MSSTNLRFIPLHLKGESLRSTFLYMLIFLLLALVGCGLSEAEIAEMTAAAATNTPESTSTPEPTATATPIPFDVTVSVVDTDGTIINWGQISIPESGDDAFVALDDSGQISLNGLPGETINVAVQAQGYSTAKQTTTLERGANDITISLERDPLQLHPDEACQPGQEVLLLEDFEDGEAQRFSDLVRPVWAFVEVDGRGTVLQTTAPPNEGSFTNVADGDFGNSVLLFDLSNWTIVSTSISFIDGGGFQRYLVSLFTQRASVSRFSEGPPPDFAIDNTELGTRPYPAPLTTSFAEVVIATFNGQVDVYVNGELIVGVSDPQPYESGTFGFEIPPVPEEVTSQYDNVVVCSLTEPFTPPPPVEEGADA